MKAMILAAGFGIRLKKFTKNRPKPLVNIGYSTKIIDITVENLKKANINKIAVNLHYKGDLIEKYLYSKYPEISWNFFFEKEILGTGGGILNTKSFFKDCNKFIIINSDIMFFLDLKGLLKRHNKYDIASLVLFEDQKDKRGIYYKNSRINGFSSDKIDKKDVKKGTFTGIHILSPKIFGFLETYKKENRIKKFSIVDVYKKIIKEGGKIKALEIDEYWRDIGTAKSLKTAREDYKIFMFIEKKLGDRIIKIKKTFQGGSNKRVFRVISNGVSRVAIVSNKEEIKSIDSVSRFFYDKKFPIPYIIKKAEKWIITEDGGENSLFDIVKKYGKSGKFPLKYYKRAIDYLEELFKVKTSGFPFDALHQRAEFDFENIKNDIEYYNRYYLERKEKFTQEKTEKLALEIYRELKNFPKSMIHRDYQSTNILINNNNELRIIDYQTMRLGPVIYDFASLVFDSYIPFNEKIINELIDYFFSLESFKKTDKKILKSAATIRLMQNLGAFGKLGKDIPFFKSKVKEAEKRFEFVKEKL